MTWLYNEQMILLPAVLLPECVERVNYYQYFLPSNTFLLSSSSALPSPCCTGVLLVGGMLAHLPAGTQQENPERVSSSMNKAFETHHELRPALHHCKVPNYWLQVTQREFIGEVDLLTLHGSGLLMYL